MYKHTFWKNLIVGIIVIGLMPLVVFAESGTQTDLEPIVVYKSPTCGCCGKWARHLQDNGFKVEIINRQDMSGIKTDAGIPGQLASCHTAFIDNYAIEGHVPAADIKRLLKERPDVAGLVVPGMPMGSPGMEGSRQDRYDVLTFTRTGDTKIFSRY